MIRRWLLWLHRWCGLAMSAFLVVAGLTGSMLAFNWELEKVFAPQLFAAPQTAPRQDLATLAERAQTLVPDGRVVRVGHTDPRQVQVDFEPLKDARTGQPVDLGFTEFFTDPWTGLELGRRRRGDLRQGLVNLMPFLYEVHWRLFLDPAGQWIMGITALVWSLDCFNGFYLTLPVSLAGFWRRWRLAWQVKRRAGFFRLNFDLHRASGLWLWPLLLVFAWSSVMMDLRPVYESVMVRVFDYKVPFQEFKPDPGGPRELPRLGWQAAQVRGRQLMAEQSRQAGFTAGEPLSLMYLAEVGAYLYEVRGSRDLFTRAPKGGGTSVMFDGDTGAFISLSQPTGEHTGNTVESWLYALHMARVGGWAYRVLVCLLGLAVALLSGTGIYVWWKKQRQGSRAAASN